MNFKKTIAKSLIVAMALGMVPVANLQTAKAAVTAVKLNGATGTATLTGAGDAAYWGVAKEVKKEGKDTVKIGTKYYKISNVQEFYKEIDVYSLLKGKGGIIAGGDTAVPDDTWVVQEIKPADVLQVQYAAKKDGFKGFTGEQAKAFGGEYGYLLATKKNGKNFEVIDLNNKIEAKLNDGAWMDLDKFFGAAPANDNVTGKLHSYGQTGSTLTFRIAGADNTWASKESKLKISGPAKGPGVKVDELKNTTSIKKGMEYQLVDTSSGKITVADWTLYNESKPLAFSTVKPSGANVTKNHAILVRTAATNKKIASKYTVISLNKAAEALNIPDLTNQSVTIDTDVILKLALSYDISKGATLSNVGKKVYEYAFGKGTDTDDKLKWKTLKAGTPDKKAPATIKPTVAKIPYKDFKDSGTHFFLRVAGEKQSKDNVVTLSGMSAHKEVKLAAAEQKLKVKNTGSSSSDTTNAVLTVKEADNTATLQLKKGTPVKLTIAAQIEKAEKTGEKVLPKLKASGVKGVAVKASKLEADGSFTITIDIKSAKDAITGDLQIDVSHESVKAAPIKITISEKV